MAGGTEGPAEGSERWPLDQWPQEQCGHLLRLEAEGECGQGGVRQQPEVHEPDLPYWSGHCTFMEKQRLQCYSTAHPRSPWANPISIFSSTVSVRTCLLVKSSIPVWGSENMAPVTTVQLYCKLNQLLWTGTGILIPISISCGEIPFKFQRTSGMEPIRRLGSAYPLEKSICYY